MLLFSAAGAAGTVNVAVVISAAAAAAAVSFIVELMSVERATRWFISSADWPKV